MTEPGTGEDGAVREVTMDSRQRISLAKIPLRVRPKRYLVTPHGDGSITLTPMVSVPLTEERNMHGRNEQ